MNLANKRWLNPGLPAPVIGGLGQLVEPKTDAVSFSDQRIHQAVSVNLLRPRLKPEMSTNLPTMTFPRSTRPVTGIELAKVDTDLTGNEINHLDWNLIG